MHHSITRRSETIFQEFPFARMMDTLVITEIDGAICDPEVAIVVGRHVELIADKIV